MSTPHFYLHPRHGEGSDSPQVGLTGGQAQEFVPQTEEQKCVRALEELRSWLDLAKQHGRALLNNVREKVAKFKTDFKKFDAGIDTAQETNIPIHADDRSWTVYLQNAHKSAPFGIEFSENS